MTNKSEPGPSRDTRLTFVRAAPGSAPPTDEVSLKILETQSGTSIFDPVLCEIAYRWFCPEGGRVLDPFAGGSVRGIVAGVLGRDYVGIDLRPEQVASNRQQAEAIIPAVGGRMPAWMDGDSHDILTREPVGEPFDFLFSCAPYGDLEVYSDDPRDLSTMDFEQFRERYRAIVAGCCRRMRPNRFAMFVVGDYRDARGFYRNFLAETTAAMEAGGMRLYNEGILITAIGSLPLRIGRQFRGFRKWGKTHQNVLVYFNGDPRKIREEFGDVALPEEVGEPGDDPDLTSVAGQAEPTIAVDPSSEPDDSAFGERLIDVEPTSH